MRTNVKSDIYSILRNHALYKELDERTIKEIASLFISKSYQLDQYVFQQFDEPDRLYIVLSGQVAIQTHGNDGKIVTLSTLGPGNIFGEFALIDHQPRSASVVVTKKANLASLTGVTFQNLLVQHPAISKGMLKALVQHLRHSNNQIESLVSHSLLQRTANHLLNLSRLEGSILRITQKTLSDQLFASREKVNAKLKELEKKGAIRRGHRKIEILSESRLSNIID